ncbi:TPA: oligosaccharide repeat unit polymerase [Vibrio alginolyticus]|nr:oligosaccharide repeat unit polymerase [Vibrio alginolyticus]
MKRKFIFVILVLVVCVLALFYEINNEYNLITIITFVFFILLSNKLNELSKNSLAISLFKGVLYIRYLLIPILMMFIVVDDNSTIKKPEDTTFLFVNIIFLFEIFLIFISFEVLNKHKFVSKPITKDYLLKRKVYLALFLILLLFIAVNPYAFHDFNFIFTVKDFNKDSGVKSEGVVSIFTILFLTVITSSVLSFISNMKIGALYRCIISCFVLVPHFLFYMGNSRLSLVIGALAWLMVLVRLYPDYNLKVKYSLISLVGFSFSIVSIIKVTNLTGGGTLSDYLFSLNQYFAGYFNVQNVYEMRAYNIIENKFDTFIFDIFRNIMGINFFFDFSELRSTTDIYNEYIYGHRLYADQIISSPYQAYLVFGLLGHAFLILIFNYLLIFFSRKACSENNILSSYLFSFISLYLACYFILNTGSVLSKAFNMTAFGFAFYYLSERYKFKF